MRQDPIERIPTSDGGWVAVKRKHAPGGTPVVFLHGLAVNADLWDLPEIRGPDYHYRSLASLLHARGYDIWLVNLRGHGTPHMYSAPPPGQTDWCVDHFILYDLPAVLERVAGVSCRRPFVVGASMGAMTLAGYLQGARLLSDEGPARIVADEELARRRQAALAGSVFAEFPALLRWPHSLYDERGNLNWRMLLRDWWRNDGDVNFPFEMLSRWRWLQMLLAAWGQVPVHWVKGNPSADPWYRRLPGPLADRAARLERSVVQAMLRVSGTFTGATHHRAEVLLHGRRYVLDHMKAGVLRQMTKCVRRGAFVSVLGTAEHVYSDYYHLVEVPTLVVQGARDRIANAEVARRAFFDRIRATDKHFILDPDIAHGEIEAAPVACERIYPRIVAWLEAHDAPATSPLAAGGAREPVLRTAESAAVPVCPVAPERWPLAAVPGGAG
jgi:pimeloyl-ACP methyl ester carboxylesterase